MDSKLVINTNGEGLWSNAAKPVVIETMDLDVAAPDEGISELRVFFDIDSWDVSTCGLIYTDRGFIQGLREYFKKHGIDGDDIDYSEQGMQGRNFVSLDVGDNFVLTFLKAVAVANRLNKPSNA